MPSWTELTTVVGWSAISKLPFATEAVLSEHLYRVGTGMYLFTVSYPKGGRTGNEPEGERYVTMAAWAACDGAVLRVFERQIEADADQCVALPPDELLPAPGAITFAEIKARLSQGALAQTASYRFSDGAFVARELRGLPFEYYFRDLGDGKAGAADPVFAISYRLP